MCAYNPNSIRHGVAAEHAHAADRFAREILGILERNRTRSRRLMRNPLARRHQPQQ
jgi:hypothetical protein